MIQLSPLFPVLLSLFLAVSTLAGCGSSTSYKDTGSPAATPSTALTGDISQFPNASLLASDGDILQNGKVVAAKNGVVLIDTRSADDYAAGHIPGAINLQWQNFAVFDGSAVKGTLLPEPQLAIALGKVGLTRDTPVIVYDNTVNSWGSAGRFFWMLEYLGNTHVRILNGGWDKWAKDALPTETATNTLPAAQFTPSINASALADKEEIAAHLNDADFVVVDTRTDEEYNGWQLYGEARGGHVTGAVHLAYATYFNSDKSILSYEDLKALFKAQGITPDKQLVSYCTAGIRSGFFYFLGRLMGYQKVANYDGSMWDWAAADPDTYPMEEMARYSDLVYPAWVKALIDYRAPGSTSAAPPAYPYSRDHKVLIFETQWGSFDDMAQGWADDSYLKGHIPGAIHSNSDTYENGFPRWFLLPDDELKAAVGSMGITADTTVVVYSDSPIFAARLWWILKYAGVTDVRVLNGGLNAWVDAGYALETTINEPAPVTYDGTIQTGLRATTDYVEAHYHTNDTLLADVRTYPEYTGDWSGYSYVVNKGRIPGAVYAGTADEPDLQYLNGDGTLRSFDKVRDMWQSEGISSSTVGNAFEKEIIFYCGGGYRSSLAFLSAYLMGYQNIRNYSDGWEGWSTAYVEDSTYKADPALPGSTDGWIQNPSGRPVAAGVHPDWDFAGYPHVDRLVSPRWVKEVLFDKNNFGKSYVIAEVSWGPASDAYKSGHIPGAIHINTDEIEYDCFNARNSWPVDAGDPACMDRSTTAEEDAAKGLGPDDSLPRNWWNIYPDPYLLPAIAYMGIDKDTTVVLYGSSSSAVARVLWTLMYAGVADVRMMEGGYNAWTAAGYAGSSEEVTRASVADFGTAAPLHPEYKVDIPYVRQVVAGTIQDAQLVDVRSHDEYIGASRPYSYIPTDGRIPGALWGSDDYTNADKTLKAPADVEAFWKSQGIDPAKHLSFYCGTAWRSSLAWFYAYMMGYPHISNFDSSWFEWSMGEGSAYNGDNPVLNPIVDDSPNLP